MVVDLMMTGIISIVEVGRDEMAREVMRFYKVETRRSSRVLHFFVFFFWPSLLIRKVRFEKKLTHPRSRADFENGKPPIR